MLEFYANLSMSEPRLVRFLEKHLNCGFMQRTFGSDEMIWSPGAYELLDLDPLLDTPSFSRLSAMQHPDDRLSYDQVEARDVAADAVSRKFRVIRRDGTLRVLMQQAETLYDREGTPDKLLSVIMDVTGEKCVEDRYKLMKARFDAFVRDPGFLTSVIRPDGYVTDVRRKYDEDQQEKIRQGFGWRDRIHPEDREESLAIFDRAIIEKTMCTREHRVRAPDGSYQWRRSIWLPVFDERQELTEFLGLSQDIDREKLVGKSTDKCLPTGAQVRGGRGLLRWSVQDLADAVKVSPSAVRRIEEYDGLTEGAGEVLAAIRFGLESAGVEFVFPPTGKPGVQPA